MLSIVSMKEWRRSFVASCAVGGLFLVACGARTELTNETVKPCPDDQCPPTLDQALEQASAACSELPRQVLAFADGTICVGVWERYGASANCYVNGLLRGGFVLSDIIGQGSDFGQYPLCAWSSESIDAAETCTPRPVTNCVLCTNLWVESPVCTAEYVDSLTAAP